MIDNVTSVVLKSTRVVRIGRLESHAARVARFGGLNTMKRMTALLMVLVMLLTGALAAAESYGWS